MPDAFGGIPVDEGRDAFGGVAIEDAPVATAVAPAEIDSEGVPSDLTARERRKADLLSQMAKAQAEAVPVERKASFYRGLDFNPASLIPDVTLEDLRNQPHYPGSMSGADLYNPSGGPMLPPQDSSTTPVSAGDKTIYRPPVDNQDRYQAALFNAVKNQAGSMLTPENMGILVATYGAGAGGKAGQIAQKAVSGTFSVEGAKAFKESLDALNAAETPEDKANAWVGLFGSAGMTLAAGTHAITPEPIPRPDLKLAHDLGIEPVPQWKVNRFRDTQLTPEEAMADRIARNRAAPGTVGPNQLEALAPPAPEPPEGMFALGNLNADKARRFGNVDLSNIQVSDPSTPPIPEELRTKMELETRGKVSFGAEAPTLLRNAVEVGTKEGLSKSVEAVKQVAGNGEPNAPKIEVGDVVDTRNAPGNGETAGVGTPEVTTGKSEAIATPADLPPAKEVGTQGGREAQDLARAANTPEDVQTLHDALAEVRRQIKELPRPTDPTKALDYMTEKVRLGNRAQVLDEAIQNVAGIKDKATMTGAEVEKAKQATAPKPADLVSKLESLRDKFGPDSQGQLFSLPHPDAFKAISKGIIHDALDLAIHAVKAGRAIGDAIDIAIQHLRKNVRGFDEAKVRANLEHLVGEETKPSATPAPSPAPAKAPAPAPTPAPALVRIADTPSWADRLPGPALAAVDKLQNTLSGLKWRFQNGKGLEKIGVLKNVADNEAKHIAEQQGNEIKNAALRAVKGSAKLYGRGAVERSRILAPWMNPNKLAESALTFIRESGESREEMARQRQVLENANPPEDKGAVYRAKWKRAKAEMLAAMDLAEKKFDALSEVGKKYKDVTDAQHAHEMAHGVESPTTENYVMHRQDLEGDLGIFSSRGSGAGGGTPNFRKTRTHATLADSMAAMRDGKPAGIVPDSINAVDLLKARLHNGNRLVQNRIWIDGIRGITDSTTGKPVVGRMVEGNAPSGYEVVNFGGQQIPVLKGFSNYFRAYTDPSALANSPVGNAMLQAATTGKHVMLMGDVFHMNRLGIWASVIQGKLTGYKKGLVLTDYSLPEIRNMVSRGELDPKFLKYAEENKPLSDMLDKAGYNTAGIADNLHAELTQHIPISGAFNKWLFTEFQRGAMKEAGIYELKRQLKNHPEMAPEDVARMVAKDLNTRFGNLLNESWLKSRTFRDIARLVFLAPQWNEGLVRSEIGSVAQIPSTVRDSYKARSIVTGGLLKANATLMLSMFAANQIINMITRGKPTWQNEEEGADAKMSAFIPDPTGSSHGVFVSPVSLPFETVHILEKSLERNGDTADAARQYLSSRLGYAGRPLYTFFTRRNAYGMPINPQNFWKEEAKTLVPAPISGGAAFHLAKEAGGREIAKLQGKPYEGTEQVIPAEYEKQGLSTLGIKTSTVPSPEQRMQSLGADFRKKHGIMPSADFFEGDYKPLTQALNIGNNSAAGNALDDLEKTKTEKQITDYFKRYPHYAYTKNRHSESEFRSTLTDEQQKAYEQALEDRRKVVERFYQLYDARREAKP